MFSFGSGVVSWSNKKQPTVALSNTKVEYRSVTITACEVVWLQKLLLDLGQSMDVHVVIYCDNISSILLANNPVYHVRTNTSRNQPKCNQSSYDYMRLIVVCD